jgi:FMN-dependent NADH-azoreductase
VIRSLAGAPPARKEQAMAKVLHVQSSPRGNDSYSIRLAREFLAAYQHKHPDDRIETLDLFAADIPVFNAPHAKAKYAVLGGAEPEDEAERAWKRVIDAIDRFKSADLFVISAPMWNFSIPHRLKDYIDVIVQPGLTFSFSPEEGYKGLLTGRKAVLILARGGDYSEAPAAGMDMQKPYLEAILGFMGITDVRTVIVQPTLMAGPDLANEKFAQAVAEAKSLAAEL